MMSDALLSGSPFSGENALENARECGIERFQFTASDGGMLPCCRYVSGTQFHGKYSLLMFLHGAGSLGNDNLAQVRIPGPPLLRFVQKHQLKTVLLFPQCEKGFQWVDVPWGDKSHTMPAKPSIFMQRALELLDEQIAHFQPDPARVYAAGVSMGGYGAWDLVCRRPHTFAGVLVLCGGADINQAPKLKQLPAYLMHGDQDPAVPVTRSRDMVEALRQTGNCQVTYIELPGCAHNVWDPCFADENALAWLFSQIKNQSTP
ncbi:MAG: phospholipase [Lentisphaeria bacterium]|nr:phospholipase [Lentisphaeria bacterium]